MTTEAQKVGQRLAAQWEAEAIEKCKNDPRVAEAGLCPVCMVALPECICECYRRYAKMRDYYEKTRRTLFRAEPKATRSWGIPVDVLMEGLYDIAHGKEPRR